MPTKTEIYHETARGKVNLTSFLTEELGNWRKFYEKWLLSVKEEIQEHSKALETLKVEKQEYEDRLAAVMAELSRREPARREMEIVEHAYAGTLEDFLKMEAVAERMFKAKRDEAAPEEYIWGAGSSDNADD